MSEILNSSGLFVPLTAEQLRNEGGVAALNNMLRLLFSAMTSDGESLGIYRGIGSPENLVAAKIGSIYMRIDGGSGTTIYAKEADDLEATGWSAL